MQIEMKYEQSGLGHVGDLDCRTTIDADGCDHGCETTCDGRLG